MKLPKSPAPVEVYPHDAYVPMAHCFDCMPITPQTLSHIEMAIYMCDMCAKANGEATQAMREDRERLVQQAEICRRGLSHDQ